MLASLRIPLTALLLTLSLGLAPTAQANPKDELSAAYLKFSALKSWRATITDTKKGKPLTTVEHQAPDRWRMTPVGAPSSVVIGGTMYMNIDGRSFQMPIGKMLEQYKSHESVRANIDSITITSASDDVLDGQPVRKIAYTQAKPKPSEAIAWISKKTGLLMRLEVPHKKHPTRLDYSGHNDASIKISAP